MFHVLIILIYTCIYSRESRTAEKGQLNGFTCTRCEERNRNEPQVKQQETIQQLQEHKGPTRWSIQVIQGVFEAGWSMRDPIQDVPLISLVVAMTYSIPPSSI